MPFYNSRTYHRCSTEKENTLIDFRTFIETTNPAIASHASDSDENAISKTTFFFTEKEIIEAPYELPVTAGQINE
mgnify:FL=1